jgi:NADH-quinone oxidoreductase subunit A
VLRDYLPIVILAALAIVFAVASLSASRLLRPNRPNPVKLSAYECGNEPVRLP